MGLAHIVVLSSALVTLLGVPCAVTAVRRAEVNARRRSWTRRPEEIQALIELDLALRAADPVPAPPEPDLPIEQIADELQQLARRRRVGLVQQSERWLDSVQNAYDDRLCMACRCLGVTEHLSPLTGMDRDLERMRVEAKLQAAGLSLRP